MPHPRARHLRKNQTDAERALWSHLRLRQIEGFRFRRQQSIGPYIVDFFCPEAKLIVEVDGGQHADRIEEDTERTEWLEFRGYKVVRYWNNEVLRNIDGVITDLQSHLPGPHPPP
jgi:very-short-patch-repair endonuclease